MKSTANSKSIQSKALVAIIMGSQSDWETMQHSVEILEQFKIPYLVQVVSAHRTPDLLLKFSEEAEARGLKVIILELAALRTYQEWWLLKLACLF